jgi:hypothetical protein
MLIATVLRNKTISKINEIISNENPTWDDLAILN